MDWLTRLPVIGPAAAWLFRTRVWRVYEHLDARKWTRLAAAITFTSFLALFPMLAVGAAVGAALLSDAQMDSVRQWTADQFPGLADELDLQSLVDHAGTVGVVAGALLLFTGAGWVGSLRESLRALWDLEEDPGNPFLLKAKDLGALVGLGAVGLVSLGGSAFSVTAVSWVAERMGLVEGGLGTVLLRTAAYAAAGAANFVLLAYMLTLLPGVRPPRRETVVACLTGAVGFELLKLLLGGYLKGVAAKSMYGAFGVPVALLLWISFMAKLLLFCAAWTAAPSRSAAVLAEAEAAEQRDGDGDGEGGTGGAGSGGPAPGSTRAAPGPSGPVSPAAGAAAAATDRTAASDGAPRTRPWPAGRERPR
ncbi:YihY/virulence factor BrkB family protein [Streptomyces daliensis]|uniref:YihY/virulence factor BrkB family protein n=1 Tax=Streptomyces daliensis TaxID=299421 RepID=A0A8T4IM42_9ACTN|nr:YihY/virulence factor BrkB family protein [Streptomyces daliensis]